MIVVSGCRPTGSLHLGNYFGAIKNWIDLQNSGKYDQLYFFIADWHALTTDYESTSSIAQALEQMARDWVACGLDPEKSVIFRQSQVLEHAELALLLAMITPLGWLERNPTYKEQLRELSTRDLQTYGFLGYPVLQAADILLYKATHVPVGQDQLPHLELTRDIARRFNSLYKTDVLVEPQAILTKTARLPGLDGRKMSKSLGNDIALTESPGSLQIKAMSMFTDPKKVRAADKGNPEGCVVFAHHQLFSQHWVQREKECREGEIGCVACKKDLIAQMEPTLSLWRERSSALSKRSPGWVEGLLDKGAARARELARTTLLEVRQLMGLTQ